MGAPPNESRKPFAYKAAQMAFVCPLIAIVFSFCLTFALGTQTDGMSQSMAPVVRTLGLGLGIVLYVLGFTMGVVALVSVPKYGAKELVVRPIVGMAMSALFLYIISAAFTAVPSTVRIARVIAGDWRSTLSANGNSVHVRMHLDPNGTASWEVTDGPSPMAFQGNWSIVRFKDSQKNGLTIKFGADTKAPGDIKGMGWTMESWTEGQLELSTDDAQGHRVSEIYVRGKN